MSSSAVGIKYFQTRLFPRQIPSKVIVFCLTGLLGGLALVGCTKESPRQQPSSQIEERVIASLETPQTQHVIPSEDAGPTYNPDLAFLILYQNTAKEIVGIWQGGVMMADPAAVACYEAIQRQRLAGRSVKTTALPPICKRAQIRIRAQK